MLPMSSTFPITCSWCLWTLLSLCYGLEFRYHNSVEVEKYLMDVNRNYPSITHRYSIGKSVEGKGFLPLLLRLLVILMTSTTASTYSFYKHPVRVFNTMRSIISEQQHQQQKFLLRLTKNISNWILYMHSLSCNGSVPYRLRGWVNVSRLSQSRHVFWDHGAKPPVPVLRLEVGRWALPKGQQGGGSEFHLGCNQNIISHTDKMSKMYEGPCAIGYITTKILVFCLLQIGQDVA